MKRALSTDHLGGRICLALQNGKKTENENETRFEDRPLRRPRLSCPAKRKENEIKRALSTDYHLGGRVCLALQKEKKMK